MEGTPIEFFPLRVGVRQGGVLSPLLFALFIDDLVSRVKSVNVGCCLSFSCCCVFLYADDILVPSPSIAGLQQLVNTCTQINVNKSCCVRFGSRFNESCSEIISKHGGVIHWAD
jgi:Reverse transcriptase (RNA-dependent DNA polymerase)